MSDFDSLNIFVSGKTIKEFTYSVSGDSDISIVFTDGSLVVISTLGGVEIEKMENNHARNLCRKRQKANG